jgi:uncharacterized delta-60 repeat protein
MFFSQIRKFIPLFLLLFLTIPIHAVPGDPDPTFGEDGYVLFPAKIESLAFPRASAIIDSNNRILVLGSDLVEYQTIENVLMRYYSDGTPDTTFGSGGIVRGSFPAHTLIEMPDGKIIVGGSKPGDFYLKRFNPDGSPDLTFGTGGQVVTDFRGFDRLRALTLTPDGKLVAVGQGFRTELDVWEQVAMAKYNADGTLDPTFGDEGIVVRVVGYNGSAEDVAVDDRGNIYVSGWACPDENSSPPNGILMRYTPGGELDTTFGDGGFAPQFANFATTLTFDRQNRIVVGGSNEFEPPSIECGGRMGPFHPIVARYNTDGSFDTSFGDGGVSRLNTSNVIYDALDIGIDPNDRIIIGGNKDMSLPSLAVLSRLLPDGAIDATFGDEGYKVINYGGVDENYAQDTVYSLNITDNGSILATGSSGNHFALAQLKSDGTPGIELLTNGSFEIAGTKEKFPANWNVKGLKKTKRRCYPDIEAAPMYGQCSLNFKGQPGLISTLTQKVNPNVSAGSLRLSAWGNSIYAPGLSIQAKIKFADGSSETMKLDDSPINEAPYRDSLVFNKLITSIKVRVKSVGQKAAIDAVRLVYVPDNALVPLPAQN